jgi:hypothetical protein
VVEVEEEARREAVVEMEMEEEAWRLWRRTVTELKRTMGVEASGGLGCLSRGRRRGGGEVRRRKRGCV